jgi:hypothetical protein
VSEPAAAVFAALVPWSARGVSRPAEPDRHVVTHCKLAPAAARNTGVNINRQVTALTTSVRKATHAPMQHSYSHSNLTHAVTPRGAVRDANNAACVLKREQAAMRGSGGDGVQGGPAGSLRGRTSAVTPANLLNMHCHSMPSRSGQPRARLAACQTHLAPLPVHAPYGSQSAGKRSVSR